MSDKVSKYKVAIVDDHALFAGSLERLINSFPTFKAIYHVRNGVELQRKLTSEKELPDVVLLDINMPVMNGFETAEWLSKTHPDLKFIALTMDDEEGTIIKMLRIGSKGYLLKDIHPDVLKTALEEVIYKGYYHSQKVSEMLVRSLNPDKDKYLALKPNELTFIKLASSEMTYKEIAEVMNLSPKTIDGYRQELFNRFEIKNRVGLVIFALKNNLIKL
jgi:DNA-binding NarL/FixJ family response regulator